LICGLASIQQKEMRIDESHAVRNVVTDQKILHLSHPRQKIHGSLPMSILFDICSGTPSISNAFEKYVGRTGRNWFQSRMKKEIRDQVVASAEQFNQLRERFFRVRLASVEPKKARLPPRSRNSADSFVSNNL